MIADFVAGFLCGIFVTATNWNWVIKCLRKLYSRVVRHKPRKPKVSVEGGRTD